MHRGGQGGASARQPNRRKPQRRRRPEESRREEVEPSVPETHVVVPADQVKLTEAELNESVPRVLTANDPNVRTNLVCYAFQEGTFKPLPSSAESEHVAFHASFDGSLLHAEGDEGQAQLSHERNVRRLIAERRREMEKKALEDGKDMEELEEEMGAVGGRNQFNYSERAAQTYNGGMKQRGITTRPPETAIFGATVSQWDIYDAYVAEFERLVQQEELERGEVSRRPRAQERKTGEAIVHSEACGWSLKMMERIAVQDAQDELYNDFKFWEDASDPHRVGGLGSLLPLWRFYDGRVRKKMVTAVAWNPRYKDMFAVGYGSYDFMRQGSGLVCVYSLKNVGHPEFIFSLESGVMCLDWHFGNAALLAVGCYDGTVKVFDVRRKENRPLYAADVKSGKHTDPVWQVRWQSDDLGKDLSFLSISSDGRVASWVLSKNELQMETLMSLKLVQGTGTDGEATGAADAGAGGARAGAGTGGGGGGGGGAELVEDEGSLTGLAGGCCFDFNPYSEHLFLVGTEEGRIHKCSKSFSGQYLATYEGHHMAVYAVKWNPWHERVFVSCSADWTVKIWDHMCPQAVMTFDLQNEVGDVAWAPYSATVFAAVTSNGKALVFDLDVNKHEQICEQKIVRKAKLTHVAFSEESPLLLVGDSNGGVNSLKLSPNLRKVTPIPVVEVKKGETPPPPPTRLEVEAGKLNEIMGAADVKAAVPITQFDGKVAAKPQEEEEGEAAAGAGEA